MLAERFNETVDKIDVASTKSDTKLLQSTNSK